jgi:hypothetical protein
MMLALLASLYGCATPEYVAGQSDWNVCRFTMGGPHARNAEAEAKRRGLDCRPYYGAIQQQKASEASAIQNYLRSTQPAAMPAPAIRNCRSVRVGNGIETQCW